MKQGSENNAVQNVSRPEPGEFKWPDEAVLLAVFGEIRGETASNIHSIPEQLRSYGRFRLQLSE
ncbi:hypothetical protein GCM10011399_32320 [Subtercola lobariae]|uniref:Uncharacterized protein n=1 Tax=Subtercola lobariae TaxID=1588641 RepID=A0A917F202_9MICO|nr:hypothetical protein GCM10011399_32320 [Subtercola lobariae]